MLWQHFHFSPTSWQQFGGLQGIPGSPTIAGVLTTEDLLNLQQAREMARSGVAQMIRESLDLSLREMGSPIDVSPSTCRHRRSCDGSAVSDARLVLKEPTTDVNFSG